MKQRETSRLCRHCRKTPCEMKAETGVTCHAVYMQLWRRKQKRELKRLRRVADRAGMAALAKKYARAA